jgi:hypothetical protein
MAMITPSGSSSMRFKTMALAAAGGFAALLAAAPADAHWDHGYGGRGYYGPPARFYAPPPRAYYPPPPVYYAPPAAYYAPPPAYYAPPPRAFYPPPRPVAPGFGIGFGFN